MYPIMFRLGYQKGKIFGFYIPVALIAGFSGIVTFLVGNRIELLANWLAFWMEHLFFTCTVIFAISVALFAVSYALSLWQYNKRDL
jgi:hypothetical protein